MKSYTKTEISQEISLECITEKMSKWSVSDTSINCGIVSQKYDISKELYTSPNSNVFLVNLPHWVLPIEGKEVTHSETQGAIKLVNGPTFCYLLDKEYNLIKDLDHPNIIKPLDYNQESSADYQCTSYLWVPYYKHGELFEKVKECGGFGEADSHHFFKQIASALEYLHDSNIAHRDIKLENILIDDCCNTKLIDFGFSYKQKTGSEKDIKERILEDNIEAQIMGTVGYMSPELIEAYEKGHAHDATKCSNSSEKLDMYKTGDIFALGVALFTMVVGVPPFSWATKNDSNYRALFLSKKRPSASKFWIRHPKSKILLEKGEISEEFKSLIEGMLDPNPADRLRINSITQHPWMQKTVLKLSDDLKSKISSS